MAFDIAGSFTSGSGEFGLAGLGLSVFGGLSAMNAAKEESQISQQEISTEEAQDNIRRQAMEFSARRQLTQQTRNLQQDRSAALAANSNAGGSGMKGQANSSLGGAYGGAQGVTGQNMAGITQNLQFGEQMFNSNENLDALKIQMAKVQSQQATDQGIASLGSSLFSVGKMFGA